MPYQILRRRDFTPASAALPPAIRRKAEWAIVQLGVRGRTPSTKGTTGHPLPWRRSPVQGSHYYLWWLNAGDSGIALNGHRAPSAEGAILVHSIRHHDETDQPLTVGDVSDYEALDVGLLDPRFEDQEEIALVAQAGEVSFTVVEGMPGSGKSVALLFLARDLATRAGMRKIRYITYTERLKRAAREIFDALGPEIAKHITVHTINDVVKELSGALKESSNAAVVSSPYSEIDAFVRDIDRLPPGQVGPWRNYPLTLYTELRAQVVGRTFPSGYQLPAHREEQMRRSGGSFDVERYARRRKLDSRLAEQAVALVDKLAGRYFLDQTLASRALEKLNRGESPSWLAHTDALIIDEVQDFTLLQIALVAEMAAVRRKADPVRPFSITVAGDESQIVQPTGFKWGVTKDLITERLKVHPRDYHFDTQRRSPPLLARLTQASWGLYASLPKDLRPSAAQVSEQGAADQSPDDAESGLVIIVPPPASFDDPDWRALLDELAARPGRALIDLTERLDARSILGEQGESIAQGTRDALTEVVFQAREIKGLERGTVLVHGLEALWQRVDTLTPENVSDRIPLLEARRLIDQMRVALSRSTSRLIVLDEPDAAVFAQLAFAPGESALHLALGDLVEMLQGEQMTDAEMITALLEEADDLAERGRMDDALRRNRRAAAIALQTSAADLLHGIRLQEGDLLMRQAERQLAAGRIADAQASHQQAEALFTAAGAAALQGERAERWQALSDDLYAAAHSEYARLLDEAERALSARRLEQAVTASFRAWTLAEAGVQPAEERENGRSAVPGGQARERLTRALDVLTRARLAWADERAATGLADESSLIGGLLIAAAETQALWGDARAADLLLRLSERYLNHTERSGHSPEGARTLIVQATELLAAADPLSAAASTAASQALIEAREAAYAHAARWLDEAYADLGGHVALYFGWATAAAHLARLDVYPAIDDRLWDLENRYEAAGAPPGPFAAFLAAYNGDPASASLIWERLGEVEMAVESARVAGNLERAHHLLRANQRAIPEELATAVKAQRLVHQLQQKSRALRPAERRALAEELARLHHDLTSDDAPPPA
jgi:hypothetical protein